MKLKDLEKGDYFTRKINNYPTGKQVYIKGYYDRSLKKYSCINWLDTSKEIFLKPETEIFC